MSALPTQPRRPGVQTAGAPQTPGALPPAHPGFVDARPVAPPKVAPVSAQSAPFAPAIGSAASVAPVANVPSIGVPAEHESPGGVSYAHAQPGISPMDHANHAADLQRHQQIQESHQALMSMALGRNGKYGNLAYDNVPFADEKHGVYGTERVPGKGLENAMSAMQAHLASLTGADAHSHAAALQFGGDIRHDPAYRAAQIGHVNAQAAHGNAQAAALDPVAEESRLKRIMADPTLRAAYEAKIGVAPGTIPVPPTPTRAADGTEQPAYHAGNAEQGLARPENSGLSAIINDPNMAFHEKLARASQIPDFANPASPTRQLFNTHMHQLFPTQQSWQAHRESHPVVGPDQWKTPIPLGPFKEWIGGPLMNFAGHLTGQGGTGTGFDWRRNYEDGQEEDGLLNRFGVKY